MNKAYFSIVENKDQKDELLVRARVEGDIEKIFPKAIVLQGAGTDYKYRTYLPREIVSKIIKEEIENIDYGNFKDSISSDDILRHEVYYDVFFDLMELQQADFPLEDYFTYSARARDIELKREY